MQRLYACTIDRQADPAGTRKQLEEEIRRTYRLYLYQLVSLMEVGYYVYELQKIKADKYVPTIEDKSFSVKLGENMFIQALQESNELERLVEEFLVSSMVKQETTKKLFQKLAERQEYKDYLLEEVSSKEVDRSIIRVIFKKLMLKDDLFISAIEEQFPGWEDDKNTIINMVIGTINEYFKQDAPTIDGVLRTLDWEDANGFVSQLFEKASEVEDKLHSYIDPILKNWDADRINPVDMILIKMALTELMYFQEIPVKVSLNEYIEISKVYSTPKSKEFINGVVDTLMKQLKKEGLIVKRGAGLKE